MTPEKTYLPLMWHVTKFYVYVCIRPTRFVYVTDKHQGQFVWLDAAAARTGAARTSWPPMLLAAKLLVL